MGKFADEATSFLPPLGPGAGLYNFPSSLTLDAQGRVTAVGARWDTAFPSVSSAAAINITAAGTSTWSNSTGSLTINSGGNAGLFFKSQGNTFFDLEGTSGGVMQVYDKTLRMSGGSNLSSQAGAGFLSLGPWTGDTTLTGGAFFWTGALTKALALSYGANSTLSAAQPAAGSATVGSTWTHTGGKGANATAGAAGAAGGAHSSTAGAGGDGSAAQAAGAGGKHGVYGASAGVNNGGGGAAGGDVEIDAGGGTGAGVNGTIQIGRSSGNFSIRAKFNSGRATNFTNGGDLAYQVLATDETIMLPAGAAARTYTLPAAPVAGQRHNFVNNSASNLTVSGSGAQKINGAGAPGTVVMATATTGKAFVSNGTDWWTLA